jgi:hypothetical protein
MSSASGLIILLTLCALAGFVVWLVRRPVRPEEAANWPVIEGTIQSVTRVPVKTAERSDLLHVGDFSYTVNNDYYSGRVSISRSFSTHDHSPKDLIDQKIQVHYNPQKPEKFLIPQQELGSFLLDPYDEAFGSDIGSVDLNIDKI